MDDKTLKNLRDRTDAKLRFAEVHLKELKDYGPLDGSDFDRAHQEAFLFQLLGVKDAFLLELNAYYGGVLHDSVVSLGKLREALKDRGIRSLELAELYKLEKDETSWLFHAKEMRDHSTHTANVGRAYHLGGESDGDVWLRNPKTGEHVERHFIDEFQIWVSNMRQLVESLRATATASMNSKTSLDQTSVE